VQARGALWTVSFWLRLTAGVVLLCTAPLAALLFAFGWLLAHYKALKPKKHTRPFPLRRHR
jgi:hypothetical protein